MFFIANWYLRANFLPHQAPSYCVDFMQITIITCLFYGDQLDKRLIVYFLLHQINLCFSSFFTYIHSFIDWFFFFILILDFQFFSIQFTHASIACCYLHVFTSYFFSWLTVTLLRFYFLSLVVRVNPVYCHQNFLA